MIKNHINTQYLANATGSLGGESSGPYVEHLCYLMMQGREEVINNATQSKEQEKTGTWVWLYYRGETYLNFLGGLAGAEYIVKTVFSPLSRRNIYVSCTDNYHRIFQHLR